MSLSIAERLLPIAGLLLVSTFLFYGLPEVTRGRTPSVRGWLWFCLWSAIVVLLLLGLPSDIFVAIAFTAAALIGGGLLIGIIDWLRSRASASRARSRARVQVREGPKALEPLLIPPPPEIEARALELQRRGFQRVKFGTNGDGLELVMFRPSDSVVAEVVAFPNGAAWREEILEFTSVLFGRRGVLSTTNLPTHPRLWRGELLQVFPGAVPDQLLDSHEIALALLAERGISNETFPVEDVEEQMRWGAAMNSLAVADTPPRELVRMSSHPGILKWMHIGPLQSDPRLEDRLAKLPASEER